MATMETGQFAQEKELKIKVFEEFSVDYGCRDGLKIRKLLLDVIARDRVTKVQKLSLGTPSPACPTKVILLIGGSGHGKTTLINAMVNFIFRVDFEDDFRFILKDESESHFMGQSDGQTYYFTAYVFNYQCGMPFAYNYVLIDTPGYGDPRGIHRDREIMDQLESFLNQGNAGVDHVDAVGIVTPASVTRLTQSQQYIFSGLSSMFGADIEDVIYILSTFADAKDPPILAALQDAKICYNGFYKFNNSAIYANNKSSRGYDDTTTPINRCYWEIGYKSLHLFFLKLGETPPVSLRLTREVLKERHNLEIILFELQRQIHLGLSKLSTLQQERDMLSRIKDDIKGCANYEEEIEVPRTDKVRTSSVEGNKGNLNLRFSPKDMKFECNLSWDNKRKSHSQYSVKWIKEKRTVNELLVRYNLSLSNCKVKESLVQKLEEDIENFAIDLIELIKHAKTSVEKLQEIALLPNPISTKEYIELLIESEEREKRHNFQKRVEILKLLKRKDSVNFGRSGSSSVVPSRVEEPLLEYIRSRPTDY